MAEELIKGLTRTSPYGVSSADKLIKRSLDHTEAFLRELAGLPGTEQEVALTGLTALVEKILQEKREAQ